MKELERLVGCQSFLFGAVERQAATRRINAFGITIILLWALSPLGGQAALRILQRSPQSVASSQTIRYLPAESSQFTSMAGGDMASEEYPSYSPLYLASLRTAKNLLNNSMDLWSNVKIPDIDSLSASTTLLRDGWHEVNTSGFASYTSLLGIPTVGVPTEGNSSFELASRYYKVDCPNVTWIANYSGWNMNWTTPLQKVPAGLSTTDTSSFSILSLTTYPNSISTNVSQINCTLSTRHVVSLVKCHGQNCSVSAMRPRTVPATKWSNWIPHYNMWFTLPWVTIGVQSHANQGDVEGSTPTEKWLFNPDTNFTGIYSYVNLSAVNHHDFSQGMQVIYNTFWQSTFGAQYIVDHTNRNMSYYDAAAITNSVNSANISFNSTEAKVLLHEGELLHCNWYYVGLLFSISIILFAAGFISVVLKSRTLPPDILGYVSSSVRDNPFVAENARHASHSDGLECSRALRNLKVTIGDVKGGEDVGYIAFATMQPGVQSLRKDREFS